MGVFIKLKLDGLVLSFKRLHCPVDKEALVLEEGSGDSLYFRIKEYEK